MEDAKKDTPQLVEFLEYRLPQLGLDSDTYGPYVLGAITTEDPPTNDDDDANDLVASLQPIMELFQASIDDDISNTPTTTNVWDELIQEIQSKWKLDQKWKYEQHVQQKQHQQALMQSQLEQAKLEQEQAQKQQAEGKLKNTKSTSSAVDEATKKAMLARFAYEDDGDNDDDDASGGEEEDHSNANKLAAAKASLERAKEIKTKNNKPSKSVEQQKTKEMKVNKQQLKEERRKRAVKGERKR